MTGPEPAPQLVDIDPDWLAAGQLPTENFGSSFADPGLEFRLEEGEFAAVTVVALKSLPFRAENFLVDEPEFDWFPPAAEAAEGVVASIAAAAAKAVAEGPGGVVVGTMAMGFERAFGLEANGPG